MGACCLVVEHDESRGERGYGLACPPVGVESVEKSSDVVLVDGVGVDNLALKVVDAAIDGDVAVEFEVAKVVNLREVLPLLVITE